MGTGSANLSDHEVGIVPRVINKLFNTIDSSKASLRVSFLEIHLEEIRDLLNPSSELAKSLAIRDSGDGEVRIEGLTEKKVTSQEELLGYLDEGSIYRSTASTRMNAYSSRSHAVFTVYLEQSKVINPEGDPTEDENTEVLTSKFHFVDLAGSERIKKTQAVGERMREGININSGLFALGKVISRLIDKKGHVPFRDSKITRLLQDSLGGNSQTLMIACISPAESNMTESLSTLRYACRARNIKNKPVVNRDQNSAKISQMQEYIKSLEEALRNKSGSPVGSDQLFNCEEVQKLQQEREFLDSEVQRLMMKNKELSQENSNLAEKVLAKESERDSALLQVQKIIEKAGLSSELLEEVKVSQEDLDQIRSQKDVINSLKEQLTSANLDLSMLKSRLTSYEQSPLKIKRPRKSLPALLETMPPRPFSGSEDFKHMEMEPFDVDRHDDPEDNLEDINDNVLEFSLDEVDNTHTGKLKKEGEEREQEHEFSQGQLQSEWRNLDLELKSKQELIIALQKARNETQQLQRHYERKITSMETEIVSVQEQRDQVLNRIEASRTDEVDHLEQDRLRYEKRLKQLKEQLASYREKLKESEIRARLQKKDETQIRNLQMEVNNMRNQKVRLQKKMKEESEKYREWKMEWEKQMKAAAKRERQHDIDVRYIGVSFGLSSHFISDAENEIKSKSCRSCGEAKE
jgi:hypothetical protein